MYFRHYLLHHHVLVSGQTFALGLDGVEDRLHGYGCGLGGFPIQEGVADGLLQVFGNLGDLVLGGFHHRLHGYGLRRLRGDVGERVANCLLLGRTHSGQLFAHGLNELMNLLAMPGISKLHLLQKFSDRIVVAGDDELGLLTHGKDHRLQECRVVGGGSPALGNVSGLGLDLG